MIALAVALWALAVAIAALLLAVRRPRVRYVVLDARRLPPGYLHVPDSESGGSGE